MVEFRPLDNKALLRVVAYLIAFITIVVYLPTLQNGFVDWDDSVYVYENLNIRSIDLNFLRWSSTAVVVELWLPLTMFSHALDYLIWGLNPLGHHLTSTLFHALNTSLVFILTIQLAECANIKKKDFVLIASSVTALLFGLHPLHVESVAWVSERKNVLSAFFFLLTLIYYLKYTSPTNSRKLEYYIACIVLFTLALMSKPVAVVLPLVFLILDYYPLKRIIKENKLNKTALLEKLPFFVMSTTVSLITINISKVQTLEVLPVVTRIVVAAKTLTFYLFKMVLPQNLAPFYPYPAQIELLSVNYLAPFFMMVIISLICIQFLKTDKGNLFSAIWVYYIVTLIPVLGIIQVGAQSSADRYTYLPSLGPFLLAGIGMATVFEKCTKRCRLIIVTSLILFMVVMANKTTRQIAIWQDSITLWSYEINHFPDTGAIAYRGRGRYYLRSGNALLAIKDFNTAIKIAPQYAEAYYSRGFAYFMLANYKEAIKDFSMAAALSPKDADIYYNRGMAYRKVENYEDAINDLNRAIELNPSHERAYYYRGAIYNNTSKHQM